MLKWQIVQIMRNPEVGPASKGNGTMCRINVVFPAAAGSRSIHRAKTLGPQGASGRSNESR